MTVEDTRVADDWFVGFHTGLVARFWRAAGATTAEQDAQVVAGVARATARRVGDRRAVR